VAMPVDERDRILGMLEAGKISAEQAAVLLDAVGAKRGGEGVGGSRAATATASAASATAAIPRPPAQLLRIRIDAQEGDDEDGNVKVNVNVPLKLARFAANFLPQEARAELASQGIDLTELIAGLGDEIPDGPLIDIDVSEGDGTKTVKVRIEVA